MMNKGSGERKNKTNSITKTKLDLTSGVSPTSFSYKAHLETPQERLYCT